MTGLLAILLLFLTANVSHAQRELRGEVGIDLESFSFSNSLKDTTREYEVNRSLSSHFLDLNLTTPVVTDQFAEFQGRAKLFGTYYRVSRFDSSASEYIEPAIPTYSASLSLLPSRPYPLRLYFDKLRSHSVRYESNNRSARELQAPELAVVRRYEGDIKSRGAMWKYSFAENSSLTSEYKHDEVLVKRHYDFGEDQNIWVSFSVISYDSTAETNTITLDSWLDNDTVLVYVDYLFVDSVMPDMEVKVPVDSGAHDVLFIPLHHNSFPAEVVVRGDMRWRIQFVPPATPNDLMQENNVATGILRFNGEGPFESETFFEYSDTEENIQRMSTYLSNFSNTAKYEFSRNSDLRTLTTYTENNMAIEATSFQNTKSFMHTTTGSWGQTRGLSTMLSHALTEMSSVTDADDFASTTHALTNQNTIPIKRLKYTFNMKNTATLLSDDSAYVNNQYATEVANSFDLRYFGAKWEPRSEIKYSYNMQKGPDQTASELETRYILNTEAASAFNLFKLRSRLQYDHRDRASGDASLLKNRYFLDVTLTRKFGKKYKIMLMTTQEKETWPATDGGGGSLRPSERKQSYKADVMLAPADAFNVSGNAMLIKSASEDPRKGTSTIVRFGAALLAEIPGLELPIRSFLISESRSLPGIDTQTMISMETKLNYRFRQITLTLTHHYVREKLLTEKYDYQEILGKISRHFSIL